MGRILKTPTAKQDLIEIGSYIAEKSQSRTVAENFLDLLQQRLEMLSDQPLLGEVQPTLADGSYRRFPHGNYVLYYQPLNDGILLIRVLHTARKHENLI